MNPRRRSAESFDFPALLETERLVIRPVGLADGRVLNEAVIESFTELQAWVPWAKTRPTLRESVAVCRAKRVRWLLREELMLLLLLKETGELAGCGGFHRFEWEVPACETGYWCCTRFTGRGLITEAVRALAEFALGGWGFRRVALRCDEGNERSRRVAERAGFQLEGILRQDNVASGGEPRTTRVYSRTG